MEKKFCIKCIYFIGPSTWEPAKCGRKLAQDLVTGQHYHPYCANERNHGGTCGMDGTHYTQRIPAHNDEPREKTYDEYAPDGRRIN